MPIRQITRSAAVGLQARIKEVLEGEFKKDGLNVKFEGAAFDSHQFKMKLSLRVSDTSGVDPVEKSNWDKHCASYGLSRSDFGAAFVNSLGDTFTIIGIHPQRYRFPIAGARVPDGKVFKFAADTVRNGLSNGPILSARNKSRKVGVAVPGTLCKYCGKRPQIDYNHGACDKGNCIIQAMRDSL